MNQFTYTNSKGVTYYLHSKVIKLKSSQHEQRIFYFARACTIAFQAELPEGFEVIESKSTGLPLLKRRA